MPGWRRVCAALNAAALLCTLTLLGGCAAYGTCGLRECPEEAEIRQAVEALFDLYPELRPPNIIYVQVRGHVVTLTGEVTNEYGQRVAESVAREAKGVTGVINMLYIPGAVAR